MKKQNDDTSISFNSGLASFAGVLGGALFAIGVPLVILNYGQMLGQATETIIVAGSVIGGGFIILVSAFFGLVMPTRVHEAGEWHKHGESAEKS